MEIHPWNRAKKQHTKASQHFVTLDLPSNACQECVLWPPCSQSACSQVSAVLFYTRTTKFMRAQIRFVLQYACFCLQAKGQQHHLSQNIGSAIAGSARPALPALSERSECIKETAPLKLFKVQSSNFKKVMEKWGGQGRPSRPASDGHAMNFWY